jgi:acetoin utilization protein AcuB
MKTQLVAVEPDDLLGHAGSLLRQHQFHHLPVARRVKGAGAQHAEPGNARTRLVFEGFLSSQDIELAVTMARQDCSSEGLLRT